MAIVFAVRGNSLDARYGTGGVEGIVTGDSSGVSIVSDAGFLSGSKIRSNPAIVKNIVWPGRLNTANSRVVSMLHRIAPRYTGSPSSRRHAMVSLFTTPQQRTGLVDICHQTNGDLNISIVNESGTATSLVLGSWSPTAGTLYDFYLAWDGTTTANAIKLYINGSLFGQGTASAALSASWTNKWWQGIAYGFTSQSGQADSDTDEIVIWDAIIDPTSVALVSGTGSLNGASRTSLVDVSAFNGASYSDPGVANVLSGVNYTYAGLSKTGTYSAGCDYPAISTVKYGVSYGNGSYTGEYGAPPATGGRSYAPAQTQIAIFDALQADTTLMTALGTTVGGTQKVFDFVPDSAAYPFVSLEISPWEDRGNYTYEGMESKLTIHTWYQPGQGSNQGYGAKALQAIQKRIDELLHKRQLAVSGWSTLICRRSLIDMVIEPDNVTRHGIQQFKLFLRGN